MRLDDPTLGLRQRSGLGENRLRNPDLANVVEQGPQLEPLARTCVEAQPFADLDREVRDPARV